MHGPGCTPAGRSSGRSIIADVSDAPTKPLPDEPMAPEDWEAMDEQVDIDQELRRRVLVTHRNLDRLDYYSLLGVARGADRKTIKRAYYDLAGQLHPDRFFRKNIGSFRARIESIFARATLAHDTLTSKDARNEYDAYLDELLKAREIEGRLAEAAVEVKRAEDAAQREARAPEITSSEPASPERPSPVPDRSCPTPADRPSTSSSPPASDDPQRRGTFAKRLLGGHRRPPSSGSLRAASPSGPSSPPAPMSTAEAMEALKRRYEERVASGRESQAKRYIANAEMALASSDVVAAASALKVAANLRPHDKDLAQRAREAQEKASAVLCEVYTRQATYEEKNGQWAEAARSWEQVCKAKPDDARAHERAAAMMIQADGDLHEAVRIAQVACEIDAHDVKNRITLATAYHAAGLALNARRELEAAALLSPGDDTIAAMLKRLGKT